MRIGPLVVVINALAFAVFLGVISADDGLSFREGAPLFAVVAATTIVFVPVHIAFLHDVRHTPTLSSAARRRWLIAMRLLPHLDAIYWFVHVRPEDARTKARI